MLCLKSKAIHYYIKTFANTAQCPDFLDFDLFTSFTSFTSFTLYSIPCTTLERITLEKQLLLLDPRDTTSKYWFHDNSTHFQISLQ